MSGGAVALAVAAPLPLTCADGLPARLRRALARSDPRRWDRGSLVLLLAGGSCYCGQPNDLVQPGQWLQPPWL